MGLGHLWDAFQCIHLTCHHNPFHGTRITFSIKPSTTSQFFSSMFTVEMLHICTSLLKVSFAYDFLHFIYAHVFYHMLPILHPKTKSKEYQDYCSSQAYICIWNPTIAPHPQPVCVNKVMQKSVLCQFKVRFKKQM